MDSKLKYRILGVALATLILMLVLPELIKTKPSTVATTTETQAVPLPKQAELEIAQPERTIDFSDENLDREANDIVFNNPNYQAQTGARAISDVRAETATRTPDVASDRTHSDTNATVGMTDTPLARVLAEPQNDGSTGETRSLPSDLDSLEGDRDEKPVVPAVLPSSSEVQMPPIQLVSLQQYRSGSPSSASSGANTSVDTADTASDRGRSNWMVQAGAFAVARNATLLREKLRERRFPASLEPAEINGKTLYLVRLGPYSTKQEGEQARARLQREVQVNGSVIRD